MRVASMTLAENRIVWIGFRNGRVAAFDGAQNDVGLLVHCNDAHVHLRAVNAMEWDPSHNVVWTGSEDGELKVWSSFLLDRSSLLEHVSQRGWLAKSARLWGFDRRWVVLSEGRLQWFEEQSVGIERGSMSVSDIVSCSLLQNGEFVVRSTVHRDITFRAESVEVAQEWMKKLDLLVSSGEKAITPIHQLATGSRVSWLTLMDENVWKVGGDDLQEYTLEKDERERDHANRGFRRILPLRSLKLDLSQVDSRYLNTLCAVRVDSNTMWLATGRDLFVIQADHDGKVFVQANLRASSPISTMALVNQREVWCAAGSTIEKWSVTSREAQSVENVEEKVLVLRQTENGNVWAAGREKKLFCLTGASPMNLFHERDIPLAMVETDEGRIWVGSLDGTLACFVE